MQKIWLGRLVLVLFTVAVLTVTIETAINEFPIMETDRRSVPLAFTGDAYLQSKAVKTDSSFYTEDLRKYRVITNPLASGDADATMKEYYIRDDTPQREVFAVAIGDSFTWGTKMDVEYGYPRLLENTAGQDVVNFGVPGAGPIAESRILETYALKLRPKVVIWQFMTNDMNDVVLFHSRENVTPPFYNVRRFLAGNSNIYNLVKRAHATLVMGQDEEMPEISVGGRRFLLESRATIKRMNDHCNTPAGSETKELIRDAKEASESNGAKFVLLMIPSKAEVYLNETKSLTGLPENEITCVTAEMKEFASENGIEYIDMVPVYRKAISEGSGVYLPLDGHLGVEGNNVTARAIYDFIVQNGYA
ncbi:MAG: hypothetical protein HYS81_02230 [Candidatus Aenigmatarchaeota archaeon]|nr:MAG: hypothetical protein HYS81_02230 [Candidatus Aenigmarchaeota archaeon]